MTAMGSMTVTVSLVPNDSDACYDPCLQDGELLPSQRAQACTAERL
ncbi:hypothetical protein [Sorangium sp. So ce861]